MRSRAWPAAALLCLAVVALARGSAGAAILPSSAGAESGGEVLAIRATEILTSPTWASGYSSGQSGAFPPVRGVWADDDGLVVCVDLDRDVLAEDGWLGMERVATAVTEALRPLAWQHLSVQAWDNLASICRPLSDFAPAEIADPIAAADAAALQALIAADTESDTMVRATSTSVPRWSAP